MYGICFLSSLYIAINVSHQGYLFLFTQPILYFISFISILSRKLFSLNNNLFYIVFIGASFIRYVVLPVAIVYSGHYNSFYEYVPSDFSYFLAIILMNVELILVSLLLLMFHKTRKNNKIKLNIKLSREKNDGYYLFILATLVLIAIFPKSLQSVNILIPTHGNNSIPYSTLENITLYCIIVSKQLIYIILMKKIWRKFLSSSTELWVLVGFLVSILNISIYFTANRMNIVINALVSMYILVKLYGKSVVKYVIVAIPLVIFIYNIVSDFRNNVTYTTNTAVSFASNLQQYSGGVYNVATAIDTVKFFPESRNIKVFLMDIFRPVIGLNIIVKNIDIPFSNILFNRTMRPNSDVVSQIIPMIGQGYIYFGAVFSAIPTLLFVKIQDLLEKKLNNTNSLEFFYFVSLSSARLGMLMGHNMMNLLNDLSMNLLLFLLVYVFNKYFIFFPTNKESRELNETFN